MIYYRKKILYKKEKNFKIKKIFIKKLNKEKN